MNTIPRLIATAALVWMLASTTDATAQPDPSGQYNATIAMVSNSCAAEKAELPNKAMLVLTKRGNAISLQIAGKNPKMTGRLRTRGKFKVTGETSMAGGKKGRFSATGRVAANKVQLVLVAEHYRGAKALCSQSWDISGTR